MQIRWPTLNIVKKNKLSVKRKVSKFHHWLLCKLIRYRIKLQNHIFKPQPQLKKINRRIQAKTWKMDFITFLHISHVLNLLKTTDREIARVIYVTVGVKTPEWKRRKIISKYEDDKGVVRIKWYQWVYGGVIYTEDDMGIFPQHDTMY